MLLLVTALFSCGSKYEYHDLTAFNMKPGALKHDEAIDILYYTRLGDSADNHFNHAIVVSRESGDTFNVLIPSTPYFMEMENMNFSSLDEEIDLSEGKEKERAMGLKRVVRIAKDDHYTVNSYPTVIGNIGKMIKGTPGSGNPIDTDSLVNALKESLKEQAE